MQQKQIEKKEYFYVIYVAKVYVCIHKHGVSEGRTLCAMLDRECKSLELLKHEIT